MVNKYSTLLLVGMSIALSPFPTFSDDESGDGDPQDYPPQTLALIRVVADYDDVGFSLSMPLAISVPGDINMAMPNVPPADPDLPKPIDPCDTTAHPVVLATGNKIKTEIDFATRHQVPIHLTRVYNRMADHQQPGLFGQGWSSNFDISLRFNYSTGETCDAFPGTTIACSTPSMSSSVITSVSRMMADGSELKYDRNATTGQWVSPIAGAAEVITRNADSTWVVQSKSGAIERYNAGGFITSIVDPYGYAQNFTYTSSRLQSVTYANGKSVQIGWVNNRVATVTDPAGNVYTYGFQPATVTFPGLPWLTKTYHYGNPDWAELTGISFNNVRYSVYDYSTTIGDERAAHSGLAGGIARDTFSYGVNADDTLYTQVTNAAGATTKFSYRLDPHDRRQLARVDRSGVTNCPNVSAQTFYDANGFVDYELDFNGNRTEYTYDAQGMLRDMTTGINSASPGAQRRTEYEWDPATNLLVWVKTFGASTARPHLAVNYEYYDSSAPSPRRVKAINVYNRSAGGVADQLRRTTYTYAVYPSKVVSSMVVDGPVAGSGDAVAYSFSAAGDLTSVANALGHSVALQDYNALGLPGKVIDANGNQTRHEYYPRGHLHKSIRVINTADVVTTFTYDAFDNPVITEYPDGRTVTLAVDAIGRITERRDSSVPGAWASFGYNLLNKLISEIYYQSASVISYSRTWGYDEIGRLISETGANGQSRLTYDNNSNLKTSRDGSNNVTTYNYNSHDEVIEIIDARNASTRIGRDPAGRPINTITPK